MESFLIAQRYVPANEFNRIAKAILLAQDIKEESWNGRNYNKTDLESAAEAVDSTSLDPFWANIIHGWNVRCWNDVQDWAKEVLANDTERLKYLMTNGPDGFSHVKKDKHEYAVERARNGGREEPDEQDELDGFRKMIDEAINTHPPK